MKPALVCLYLALFVLAVNCERLKFSSRKAAINAARQLQQNVSNDAFGFSLLNTGNTGFQKYVNLEGQEYSFNMLFEVATHFTYVINEGTSLEYVSTFSEDPWTPTEFVPTTPLLPNETDNQAQFLGGDYFIGGDIPLNLTIPAFQSFVQGSTPGTQSFTNATTLTNYSVFIVSQIPQYGTAMGDTLAIADADGMIGLGLRNNTCRFLTNLTAAVGQPVNNFSLFTSFDPNGMDVLSEIIFNSFDTRYADGDFVEFSNADSDQWSINVNFSYMNGQVLTSSQSTAFFSSATTAIGVPQAVYDQLYNVLPNPNMPCTISQGVYYCHCQGGQLSQLPDLIFTLNGQNFTVPPVYYATYLYDVVYNNLASGEQQLFSKPPKASTHSIIKGSQFKFDAQMNIVEEEEVLSNENSEFSFEVSDVVEAFANSDTGFTAWGNNTYTFDYNPALNTPMFPYQPDLFDFGYHTYNFFETGPIIIENYAYWANSDNPDGVSSPDNTCMINMFPNTNDPDNWVFGIPFLQSYYTIFNTQPQPSIFLAPTVQPIHFWVATGIAGSHLIMWIVIGVGATLLIASLVYCATQQRYRRFFRRNRHNNQNNNWENQNQGNNNNNNGGNKKKKKGGKKHKHERLSETEVTVVTVQNPNMYQQLGNQQFGNPQYQQFGGQPFYGNQGGYVPPNNYNNFNNY